MKTKNKNCLNCGKEITQKHRNDHEYKYCTRKCFHETHYGKTMTGEITGTRNPLYLEAAKLIREGLTQKEAAERVGVNKNTLNSWLRRQGLKNKAVIYANHKCGHCGKSLAGMTCISRRKYCSDSCGDKAMYRRKHIMSSNRQYKPVVYEEVMEMYLKGMGGSAIARHFDIPAGTVLCWIHKFNTCKSGSGLLKKRLRSAKDSSEWVNALQTDSNNDTNDKIPVRLVCGNTRGQSVNRLTTIITESLKSDPFNGDVYAFCNKEQTIITTITWRGTMFNITTFPKLHGTFIWPNREIGTSFEIGMSEFENLISCCKQVKYIAEKG